MIARPLDPAACRELVTSPRWLAKVAEDPETGCLVWTGYRLPNGYGRVYLDGSKVLAHRAALVAALGRDLESELVTDHLCRNRACVNPEHLEEVTTRGNVLRGEGPSAVASRRRVCPVGHPLEGVYGGHPGRRECRECHRGKSRRQGAAVMAAARALGLTQRTYHAQYGRSIAVAEAILASQEHAA